MTHLEVVAILTVAAAWALAVDWVWRNRHLFRPNPPAADLLGAHQLTVDEELHADIDEFLREVKP